MGSPDFWSDVEAAQKVVSEFKALKDWVLPFEELQKRYAGSMEMLHLLQEEEDEDLLVEFAAEVKEALDRLSVLEFSAMLDGESDKLSCYLNIHAGAGGTDSSDWAAMLLRMYTRWIERRGFRYSILDFLPNEEAGIKRVVLKVDGAWAFGFLRSEVGVHRLVRISPFDFNQRRHTSFASVDILPQMEAEADIEILDRDLRIETYRSSGAGGQHVNVTDSAVRITHVPTGIIAQCQNERSQHRNRAEAMKMLKARLVRLRERERQSEMQALYSEKGEIAWGNQIRSYILHPYTLVKDHRTGHDSGNVQAVLDGALDPFIRAYLMM